MTPLCREGSRSHEDARSLTASFGPIAWHVAVRELLMHRAAALRCMPEGYRPIAGVRCLREAAIRTTAELRSLLGSQFAQLGLSAVEYKTV